MDEENSNNEFSDISSSQSGSIRSPKTLGYDESMFVKIATSLGVPRAYHTEYVKTLLKWVRHAEKAESKPIKYDNMMPKALIKMKAKREDGRPLSGVRYTQEQVLNSNLPERVAILYKKLERATLFKREVDRQIRYAKACANLGFRPPAPPQIIALPEGKVTNRRKTFETIVSPLSFNCTNNMHLWLMDQNEDEEEDEDYIDYSAFADENYQYEDEDIKSLTDVDCDKSLHSVPNHVDILKLDDPVEEELESPLPDVPRTSPTESVKDKQAYDILPKTAPGLMETQGPITGKKFDGKVETPEFNTYEILPPISTPNSDKTKPPVKQYGLGCTDALKLKPLKPKTIWKSTPAKDNSSAVIADKILPKKTLQPLTIPSSILRELPDDEGNKTLHTQSSPTLHQTSDNSSNSTSHSPFKTYSTEDINAEINHWYGHSMMDSKPIKIYSASDIAKEIQSMYGKGKSKTPSPEFPPINIQAKVTKTETQGILVHPNTYLRKITKKLKKEKHVRFAGCITFIPIDDDTMLHKKRSPDHDKYKNYQLLPSKKTFSHIIKPAEKTGRKVLGPHVPKPPSEKKPKILSRRHFKIQNQNNNASNILDLCIDTRRKP